MLTNRDVLRSPDGEGASGDPIQPPATPAEPPAQQAGQAPPPADMLPRSEAIKAFQERDAAKARARELEAEVERLKAAPAPKPQPAQPATQQPSTPASDDTLAKELRELREQVASLADARKAEAEAARTQRLVGAATSQIPNASMHSTVEPLVRDMIRTGKVAADADPATVTQALKQHHPALFAAAPGSAFTGAQRGPDGKVANWADVRSLADLTPEQIADMPHEKVAQIVSGNTSGATGLRIAARPTPPQSA